MGFDTIEINLVFLIYLFALFLEHQLRGGKYEQKSHTNILRYLRKMSWNIPGFF